MDDKDKKPSLGERLITFVEEFQALLTVFVVVVIALVVVLFVLAALWAVVGCLAVGLYKLFTAFWKRAKNVKPKDIVDAMGDFASGFAVSVSDQWRVSNPFVKALMVWTCRIFGILGCLGGIGASIDVINGESKPDDPGLGSIILVLIICGAMIAFGFWPRRKNKIIQSK